MDGGLAATLAAGLGSPVVGARPLSGGDINDAYEVTLDDGRKLFVKSNASAPGDMFIAEARGLAWLGEAKALRVPAVVAASGANDVTPFLALEMIEQAPRAASFDERLGRGLAALHRHGAGAFGLDHDNYVGRLPQANKLAVAWPEFYRVRRLGPQLKLAVDGGLASVRMRRGFERLFAMLDELCGPAEPPSRLHGDLWGGNLIGDEHGEPVLIDPAVYGGHREIDLAMMRLFGGFGPRVFAAYEEAWPLAHGHAERVPLYQLYPLMVHVNLFGGGYVGSVESALAKVC
jgi:protein-ribulosamine 3-kinase